MLVRKPPAPLDVPVGARAVFLAGSIDLGSAVDWQAQLTAALADHEIVVCNPRRDAWDASVGCPDGFWRKGNVEVVCARFAVPLVGDWETFVARVVALSTRSTGSPPPTPAG